MPNPDMRSWLPAKGALRFSAAGPALRRPLGWHSVRAISRPVWAAIGASVAGLVMLLGFQQVISQSVVQIDRERAATAVLDNQVWHCKRLNRSDERKQCLVALR